MAHLSLKELAKRNNFSTFVKRISIGQGFYLVGQDKLVLLDPEILEDLWELESLNRFREGRSIVLPLLEGGTITLSQIYKDSGFSARTQNTTVQQDLQIHRLSAKLEEAKRQTQKGYVKLRVADTTYDVVEVKSSGFGNKSDFHFVDTSGKDVCFISHKHGESPRDFQQWSGTSKRFQKEIFEHYETQDFILELQKLYPNGLPSASTVARKIKDQKLKKLAAFGVDYGTELGYNNVEAIIQGDILLKNIGDQYLLRGSHTTIKNNELPSDNYEPVFLAVHKRDRSDHWIKNARITINPLGGRRIKQFI